MEALEKMEAKVAALTERLDKQDGKSTAEGEESEVEEIEGDKDKEKEVEERPNQFAPTPKTAASLAQGPSSALLDAKSVAAALSQMLSPNEDRSGELVLADLLIDGCTLDSKIKNKILEGDYVELASVLPTMENYVPSTNINVDKSANNALSITSTRIRKVSNIFEWLQAFHIYASVYTEKFPLAAPQMFSYANRIMSMASDQSLGGFIWRVYDEQFRKLKALMPNLQWHIRDEQILSKAKEAANRLSRPQFGSPAVASQQHRSKNQSKSFKPRPQQVSAAKPRGWQKPNGLCWNANEGKSCAKNPCTMKHICWYCFKEGHFGLTCKDKPFTASAPPKSDGTN